MFLADFKMGLISAPYSKDFDRTGKKEIKLSFPSLPIVIFVTFTVISSPTLGIISQSPQSYLT